MALREFTDETGCTWRVWDTMPSRAEYVQADRAGGWLTFAADHEKRRLAPVPTEWGALPEAELLAMLRTATPVVPRDEG
jgi:hypothetical protein